MQKQIIQRECEALADTLEGTPFQDTHCLRQAKKTGVWLTVQPQMVNGMELGA